jgi:Mrp family chromosome partitioning ATPase
LWRSLPHCWLVALSLGIGSGAIAARVAWHFLSHGAGGYVASCTIDADWNSPRLSALVGEKDKHDPAAREHVLTALLRSRPVLEEALNSAHDKNDKTLAALEHGLHVDCRDFELVRISLEGSAPDRLPALVNAVKNAYLKIHVERERAKSRGRLETLDRLYKDAALKLDSARRDLQRAAAEENPKKLEEQQVLPRLQAYEKQRDAVEIQLIRARLHQAMVKSTGAAKKPSGSQYLMQELLESDPELAVMKQKAMQILDHIRAIERVAARPSKLIEYKDLVQTHQELRKSMAKRRALLTPLVRDEVLSRTSVADTKSEIEKSQEEVTVLEGEARALKNLVEKDTLALKELHKTSRAGERKQTEYVEDRRAEITRLEKASMALLAESESLRRELNGPVPARSLEDAQAAQAISAYARIQDVRTAGATGLAVFVVVGLIVCGREHRLRRIHSPEEIIREAGLNVLGTLPAASRRIRRHPERTAKPAFAEAMDSITSVFVHETELSGAKVVLLTSALNREGKSTLTSHLAVALARTGKRVAVMEGNFANPSVHRLFGLGIQPGLSDLMNGDAGFDEAVRATRVENLNVLSAGNAALAQQGIMRGGLTSFLIRLRNNFDVVLIDAPAVLTSAMALKLAGQADAAIFTLVRNVSGMMPLGAAVQRLALLDVPILGSVVLGETGYAPPVQSPQPAAMPMEPAFAGPAPRTERPLRRAA